MQSCVEQVDHKHRMGQSDTNQIQTRKTNNYKGVGKNQGIQVAETQNG